MVREVGAQTSARRCYNGRRHPHAGTTMPDPDREPVQPVSGTVVPRYAGPATFARLPELRDVERCDVAIVGIPFDAGTSYRPGAPASAPRRSVRRRVI